MSWTESRYRDYVQRRLASEERTRTKIREKHENHTQNLSDMGRDTVQSRPVAGQRQQSKDKLSVVRCNVQKMPSKQAYTPVVVIAFFREHGIPEPRVEYRFDDQRKWRFDFAWINLDPSKRVALEVQGGLFSGGAHAQGMWIVKEHEKRNRAAVLGWRILYCQPKELMTKATADMIRDAL